jgi:choline-sulfatase
VDDVNSSPNIVLVLADQLGADALPAYGNGVARAPRLTRLAAEGVVFERALCASPLCAPSRAALLTGLLPSRTGAVDNAAELPASVPTLAHGLRLRGYRTVLVGKMHFIGPDQLHGFEERPMTDVYPAGLDWIPDWDLADDERLPWYHDLSSVLRAGPVRSSLQLAYDAEVVARARSAIEAHDGTRPLLLVVSFAHPHDPYEAPAEYWARYEGVEIDPPASPEPGSDRPTRRLRAMVDADGVAVSPEQTLRARRGYYAAVSLVDDHLGAVLDALAERGLADDTIVVVSSDHGDMRGERGLWYKMAPFEGSIRVPLVVHCPRRFEARRVPQPVSLLDLAPTLVELGGGRLPGELDGVSLAGVLAGGAAPVRDLPLEYLAEGVRAPQVTLVRGGLKLVRSLGDPDLVYDVHADPAERNELGEEPSLRAAADRRWDLIALDREVRASQRRRRLVARALATGKVAAWDHPEGARRYVGTGDDFWATLERARRV